MQSTTLPPLKGTTLKYRVYTVEHGLPFDAVPAYADGGPVTTTVAGWCVSYATGGGESDVKLRVYRSYGCASAPGAHHALYGTRYPSVRDAARAAYEAGVLGLMVYERDAAKWGLPTG